MVLLHLNLIVKIHLSIWKSKVEIVCMCVLGLRGRVDITALMVIHNVLKCWLLLFMSLLSANLKVVLHTIMGSLNWDLKLPSNICEPLMPQGKW